MAKKLDFNDLSSEYILAGFTDEGTVAIILPPDEDTALELLDLLTTAIEQHQAREGQYIQ